MYRRVPSGAGGSTLRTLALLLAVGLAPPPLPAAPQAARPPTISVTAAEVAVDFVVRDRKGRIVRDLKPNEVEVYEDGVRQDVGLFQLMTSVVPPEEAPVVVAPPGAGGAGPAARPAAAPPSDVEREAVVALVFDRLGAQARVTAHDSALEWLKLPALAGRQVGVFRIDRGLRQLQEFTEDRATVQEALDDLERMLPTAHDGRLERERLRGLRSKLSILEGRVGPKAP